MKFPRVLPHHTNVLRMLILITHIGACAGGEAFQSWTTTRGAG